MIDHILFKSIDLMQSRWNLW